MVGQQATPSTAVPHVPAAARPAATPGQTNTLAVVSLVTAIVAPLGHLIAVGGLTMILVSIVTGHMARREIKRTGEKGDGYALAGLIISYVHLAALVLAFILFFGLLIAWIATLFHFATSK